MDNKLENNEWMNEAPYLAKLPRENPFSVPPGYFEGLQEKISANIYFDNLKQEAGVLNQPVPEGYFEQLTENIQDRIRLEELKALVPESGYTVPEDYFSTLQSKIERQINPIAAPAQKGKIIKLWRSKITKYAVAASVVIISAIGLYVNQPTASTDVHTVKVAQTSSEDQALFDIDEQSIINQIQSSNASQTTNTTASETDIENYILSNYSQNDIVSNM